jgi:8-oxo-dGTP pyrophosphatase MutT (NUDIX family)
MKHSKSNMARQVAALPIRLRDKGVEVCLVTTRRTKRWSIPKGWPMKKKKDHDAAATEAKEEAGLIGRASKEPIGRYRYQKRRLDGFENIEVDVYRLDVTDTLPTWPEMAERDIIWVSVNEAAALVQEKDLSAIIHRAMPVPRGNAPGKPG